MRRALLAMCCVVATLASAVTPRAARADERRVVLSGLRAQHSGVRCPPGGPVYCFDRDAYARLTSALGFALARVVTTPAATLGSNGAALELHTSVAGVDAGAPYFRRAVPARRSRDAVTAFTAEVRKGLPLGIEAAGTLGRVLLDGAWLWGASLRVAPLEGLDRGAFAYLPDVAVGGAVRVVMGLGGATLILPSVDLTLSKPFVAGERVVLSPLLSARLHWTLTRASTVDLTPEVDALGQCAPAPERPLPTCGGDAANDVRPPRLSMRRVALSAGLALRVAHFSLSGAVAFDVAPPDAIDRSVPPGSKRQWALDLGAGVLY
ncbi:MAG: hypothetical protein KC543_04300 [Myxococcales bacterium]|nr:hypothetical protein [Myxococcales bacterium]